jgi:hypothetical protein
MSVDLPVPGGPTTATTIGGGSMGVRSIWGTCSFFSFSSIVRLAPFSALLADLKVNAYSNEHSYAAERMNQTLGLFLAAFFLTLTGISLKNLLTKIS